MAGANHSLISIQSHHHEDYGLKHDCFLVIFSFRNLLAPLALTQSHPELAKKVKDEMLLEKGTKSRMRMKKRGGGDRKKRSMRRWRGGNDRLNRREKNMEEVYGKY